MGFEGGDGRVKRESEARLGSNADRDQTGEGREGGRGREECCDVFDTV